MKKYRCTFRLGLENALEYRADFFLSLLSTVFPIIIQTFLWTFIYSSPNASVNNGYTYSQIMLYTLLAGMVSKLVANGFEHEINQDIKTGGLNKFIVRPIGYLPYRLCSFAGGKVPAAGILAVVVALVLAVAAPLLGATIDPVRIPLFLGSLALGVLLNFAIFYCIAMLGFWFTEIANLFGTINIVVVVISGGVFPLDIFGPAVKRITDLLPFKYTTQFPVDVINGKLAFADIGWGLLSQGVWIALLLGLAYLMWNRGLKRYVAVGG